MAKVFYNGVEVTGSVFHNGVEVQNLFLDGILAWQNRITFTTNVDAYNKVALGKKLTDATKGDLTLTVNGVLQAPDGSFLGKNMDVWFTSENYALTATQFINGCYAKADGSRCADGKVYSNHIIATNTVYTTVNAPCIGFSTNNSTRPQYTNQSYWA